MKPRTIKYAAGVLAVAGIAACTTTNQPTSASAPAASPAPAPAPMAASSGPDLQPLPVQKVNQAMADMGKYLFFDVRLSGDAAISCASCHDPKKGWTDGQPLGKAYPASEGFRNTPTILNATLKSRYHWDGRLDGADAGTLVRDQITEAIFMNMDSRLMQERLKQVPEYNAMWRNFRKDDINGMRVFNVVGEFMKTVTSKNVPFDKFKAGDANAMSAEQMEGYALFKGKANCVSCHNGPVGSDGKLHKTGVPENPALWNDPLRAISMLRHYSTHGMPNYMKARTDVGSFAITKEPKDAGKFSTPSIRDLKYTAPYMHNGMFASLEQVVDFYDKGGGPGAETKPLSLSVAEKKALVAFLRDGLSGDPVVVAAPKLPDYKVWAFGKN